MNKQKPILSSDFIRTQDHSLRKFQKQVDCCGYSAESLLVTEMCGELLTPSWGTLGSKDPLPNQGMLVSGSPQLHALNQGPLLSWAAKESLRDSDPGKGDTVEALICCFQKA